ncbi:MAG TPA: hypothetical protein VFE62_20430 [Gemmataceae bacterium]|nr:hypothetical protein [Gemmataceae bacterium]
MTLAEFGEAFLWFCLAGVISLLGVAAAVLAICINYFRGTKGGKTPLVLTILTALSAIVLWVMVYLIDPLPVGLIFGAVNSAFTMLAITSWLNRSDKP